MRRQSLMPPKRPMHTGLVGTPENSYWSKLQRLSEFKAKKWHDSSSQIIEIILLKATNAALLIADNGTVTALSTEDSTVVEGEVEWEATVKLPSSEIETDLCHAAYDEFTNRVFFTVFPPELGVFQAHLSDIEREGRLAAERRHSITSSEITIDTPPPTYEAAVDKQADKRCRTQVSAKLQENAFSAGRSKSEVRGKVSLTPELMSFKLDIGLKLVNFIPKQALADRSYRWFFGIAAVEGRLFACHRLKPNTISIWSTNKIPGEMLFEIDNSNLVSPLPQFQPFGCVTLVEDNKDITLAVVDSYHQLVIFKVVDNGSTFSVDVTQAFSNGRGNAKDQFSFPISLHINQRNGGSLWVADGSNSRIQLYERVTTDTVTRWNHVWSSINLVHTIIPHVGMQMNVHGEKGAAQTNKPKQQPFQGPDHTWILAIAIPTDTENRPYIIASLSEKEAVCLGTAGENN